jgi:phenylpropionate dioxygenase-like ring-hydroxylating dioxygenase large terminal subunit
MHVSTFPAQEAHGFVYAWYGEPQIEYPPLPFFDMIDDSFSFKTLKDHWATHYSRAIENQLDVVHLPFIHRTTIGRGNKTIVNGPLSRLISCPGESDILDVWVFNEVDTGQTPKRTSDLPEPQRHASIQFRFPNIWHNWISDDMHIVVAFVPIDDANTLMYLRYYQRIVKAPVLRQAFNFLGTVGNLVIERQDKRVVITQEPKRADLDIGEKLIPGDGPIITYRRRRRELIEKAAVPA